MTPEERERLRELAERAQLEAEVGALRACLRAIVESMPVTWADAVLGGAGLRALAEAKRLLRGGGK